MREILACPQCGGMGEKYSNPAPTVDVLVYDKTLGLLLVERGNAPFGFALPGGFVDVGESAESAAVREIREETGLDIVLTGLLGVYSRPDRDPRRHTLSVVFTGCARDTKSLRAGDDARQAAFYKLEALPDKLAFDHAEIISDFILVLHGQRALAPAWQGKIEQEKAKEEQAGYGL